jgi:hypothetical protein
LSDWRSINAKYVVGRIKIAKKYAAGSIFALFVPANAQNSLRGYLLYQVVTRGRKNSRKKAGKAFIP